MDDYKNAVSELQKLMAMMGGVKNLSPSEQAAILDTADLMLKDIPEDKINSDEFSRLKMMLKGRKLFEHYDKLSEAHGQLTNFIENFESDSRVVFHVLVHLLIDYAWDCSEGNVHSIMAILQNSLNEAINSHTDGTKQAAD